MVAIFVALMFIGFILVDIIVQKLEARRAQAAWNLTTGDVLAQLTAPGPGTIGQWAVPEGVHVSAGHAWLKPGQHGNFQAGADALVSHALGTVGRIILPSVGARLEAGDALFHLELDGRVLTVTSPVAGRVISVNGRLRDRPSLVTDSPYNEGWVCSLSSVRPQEERGTVRWGEKAAAWLQQEFERFHEFISVQRSPDLAVGLTSQDGGAPASGSLAQFDAKVWNTFEREFLRPG